MHDDGLIPLAQLTYMVAPARGVSKTRAGPVDGDAALPHDRPVARQSAGLLLYRRRGDRIEVFLVHPGGPFWARKDEGAWTIPKGEPSPSESLLETAFRELTEETGIRLDGVTAVPLRPVVQAGGKTVHAWAVEADVDADAIVSNTFTMEWPRGSGRMREFPEVDRAAWFDLDEARRRINPAQVALLEELEGMVG